MSRLRIALLACLAVAAAPLQAQVAPERARLGEGAQPLGRSIAMVPMILSARVWFLASHSGQRKPM